MCLFLYTYNNSKKDVMNLKGGYIRRFGGKRGEGEKALIIISKIKRKVKKELEY